MAQPLTALVVMPCDRSRELLRYVSVVATRVLTASSCDELGVLLRREPTVAVVLTDTSLPDGSWCDVLDRTVDLHPRAAVVVCARLADERLWTEVLGAGGFDILAEPYREGEVRRVLGQVAERTAREMITAA